MSVRSVRGASIRIDAKAKRVSSSQLRSSVFPNVKSQRCPHCNGFTYRDFDGLTCLICARTIPYPEKTPNVDPEIEAMFKHDEASAAFPRSPRKR